MKKAVFAAFATAAAAALVLTGCTPATSESSAEEEDVVMNDCVEAVAADVEAAREPAPLVLPETSVDATALEGSKVLFLGLTLNEFTMSIIDGFEDAAERTGVEVIVWDGQGAVNKVNEGIETAIAQGVDAIAMNGVDPDLVPSALEAAKEAGIPVIAEYSGDIAAELPDTIYSNITSDFVHDGETVSKWALADSGCDADMLMVSSSTISVWESQREGSEAAFEEFCPEDCSWTGLSVDLANLATDTPAQVQSALQRNADIDYIYLAWDGGTPFITSVVASAGRDIKVASRDGIEAALTDIVDGGTQTLTLATPPGAWIGYATMDDVFRAISGMEPSGIVIPGRLVDAENVGDGSVESVSPNYVDFESAFMEVWGVSE